MKSLAVLSVLSIFALFGCTNGKYGPAPCVEPLPSGIYEMTTTLTVTECPFKYMFRTNSDLLTLGDGNRLLECGYHEVYDVAYDTESNCDMFITSYLMTNAEFIHGDGSIYYACVDGLECIEYYEIELYPW